MLGSKDVVVDVGVSVILDIGWLVGRIVVILWVPGRTPSRAHICIFILGGETVDLWLMV